jgi:hypothetical protein
MVNGYYRFFVSRAGDSRARKRAARAIVIRRVHFVRFAQGRFSFAFAVAIVLRLQEKFWMALSYGKELEGGMSGTADALLPAFDGVGAHVQ